MEYDIQKTPFLQRLCYLHYARFKIKCDGQNLNKSNLAVLLKWHNLSLKAHKSNKRREIKINSLIKMYIQGSR